MKPVNSDHFIINSEAQKHIRTPVQQRGIKTKEKILSVAYALFCEKGYYKTTTNEIAQRAGVSIGSLYSYFKDKDVIFFEILDLYHKKFRDIDEDILNDNELVRTDAKKWFRLIIENLIKIHEESKEFNRELYVVSFYNSEVDEILTQNRQETMNFTIGSFASIQNEYKIKDFDAFINVAFDLIDSTVDRVVFGKNEINRERLINTTVDIICTYLDNNKSE